MPTPSTRLVDRVRGLAGRARTAASVVTAPEEPDSRRRVVKALGRQPATRRVPLTDARVAVAASPRTTADLAGEWTQTALSPQAWRDELDGVALLVVEVSEVSAGQVAGWPAGSPAPTELAQEARAHGIPAAAWVTGEPAHEVLAALRGSFDTVLEAAPAVQVRSQTPVTQPAAERLGAVLVRDDAARGRHGGGEGDGEGGGGGQGGKGEVGDHGGDVSAGGEDGDDTGPDAVDRAALVSALERSGLVIHEWELPDPEIRQPDAALSAHYDVLLDVGERSLQDVSPLLDAMATRTAVVTTPDRAAHLPTELQAHVAAVDPTILRRQTAVLTRQPELRDRMVHLAHRALLAGHTVTDRSRQLLEPAGIAPPPGPRTVSVVVPTNRPHEIDNVLANAARQVRVETELVLLAHGIDVDAAEVAAKGRDLGLSEVTIVPVPRDRTLGTVLNRGIEVSSGAYVAKMDDDNYYGPHFLGDLVDAFASTSAGITGKWAHYIWLRSTGAVVLRFENYENTYHRLVQGGSIVATREVAQDIRFSDIPRAVDSDFLNRAMAAGVQTWSADRYNFVSIRGTDRHSHTWQLDDLAFLTGAGRVVTYGDPRELVTL